MKRMGLMTGLAMLATIAGGCGTPRASIGYSIPGTPISVGMSVPLDRDGNVILDKKKSAAAWVQLPIRSTPAGAEILVDGELVGSTPSEVSVPFEKGFWGGPKGTAQILLRKPGYLPEGFRVFAVGRGELSLTPDGPRATSIEKALRADR